MERDEQIEHIRAETHRLADAAVGNLDRPVPSCPDWDVGRLVWHCYGLLHVVTALASGQVADPSDYVRPDRPADEELVAAFLAAGEGAADTLSSLDPAMACWSWSSDHTAGFWQRRLPHELSIHAYDGTLAAGRPQALDPALAVDGVDEFLELFVGTRPNLGDGEAISAHLHATDADGEWLVAMGGGAFAVERAHAKGDVAIRATASDLVLMLWGRRSPTADVAAFEVFGADEVLADFLGRVRPA